KTRGFGCLQVKKPLCAALICGRRRVMEAMPRPIAVLSGFTGKDFVSVDIGGLIREYLYLINRPGFLQVNRHPGVRVFQAAILPFIDYMPKRCGVPVDYIRGWIGRMECRSCCLPDIHHLKSVGRALNRYENNAIVTGKQGSRDVGQHQWEHEIT